MALPIGSDVPAWATWATLAALAMLAALTAVAGGVVAKSRSAEAPMGIWSHIAELRRRLVRMVLALIAAIAVVFLVRVDGRAPYVAFDAYDNLAAQVFRRMAHDLVPTDVRLVVTGPTDGFVAVFDVALALGVLVALPYLLAQLTGFFRPALRQHERRIIMTLVAPATLLFIVGVLFAYVVVLPAAYDALYSFASVLGADTLLQANAFVSFTLMFVLMSGVAFQTPLVMAGLARVGIGSPSAYLRKWRHAVVVILIVAAVVTPDPTPVSQLLVAGPLLGLYFLGIGLAVPARRAYDRASM